MSVHARLPNGQGQPRYLAVAHVLIDEITRGEHAVGALIPTELELCARFGVSRHTVREAIRRLSELGLVARQAGVGTRVQSRRQASRYVHFNEGSADLFQFVRDVQLVLTERAEVISDEAMAELLECRPGQAWLRLRGERHMAGEERPIALAEIYIAWPYRDVLDGIDEPVLPIYSMIEERYGCVADEVHQDVRAILLDETTAHAFGNEPGEAGLEVMRKYRSADGELFEVAVNLHPGDRFSQSMTLKLESGPAHTPKA
jgi:GntR family transcriptional regulator